MHAGDATINDDVSALVISLSSETGRRSFQSEQLSRLGIKFRFLDAKRPDDIDDAILAKRAAGWARPLRSTEVACLLSHREAWNQVASGTQVMLILEDDIVLSQDLKGLLSSIRRESQADCINLETFRRPKLLSKKQIQIGETRYKTSQLFRDRGGAAAYLLSPEGARKLLSFTKRLSPLADTAIDVTPGLRRLQVEPAAAIQAMFLSDRYPEVEAGRASHGQRPEHKNACSWLYGKLLRFQISIRLGLRRIATLSIAKNRLVPFAGKEDGNH